MQLLFALLIGSAMALIAVSDHPGTTPDPVTPPPQTASASIDETQGQQRSSSSSDEEASSASSSSSSSMDNQNSEDAQDASTTEEGQQPLDDISKASSGAGVIHEQEQSSPNIQRDRTEDSVEVAAASLVASVNVNAAPAPAPVLQQRRTPRTFSKQSVIRDVSASSEAAVAAAALAAAAAQVGQRVRPRQRAYARPYIKRVWLLPRADNVTAYRESHAGSIRSFAHAINDTNTFLRFLKEEERRLGLRIGAEDEDSLRDAAASLAALPVPPSKAPSSVGSGESSQDNSISAADAVNRADPPSTLSPSRGLPKWFVPTVLPHAASSPVTVLPLYAAYVSSAASTPAAAFAYPRREQRYRGLSSLWTPANRTTPYTVTPIASYRDPNATFMYEALSNRFTSLTAGVHVSVPSSSAAEDTKSPSDEDDDTLRNALSSSGDSGGSYFSISSKEASETEEKVAPPPRTLERFPLQYRDIRRGPESGHAGRYFIAERQDSGASSSAPAAPALQEDDDDLETRAREFRNRPMVPMSDAYNLQTAPKDSVVNASLRDPMAMSPSTIEPRIVEVYSVSPNSYYYISTTVQPPAFVNSTAFPSEFDTATGDFGNYQQPTNEFRTEKKHSARYQAKNTLSNYNPFSIYPKYRATYVPKKEHSVKVVSSSTPQPPPPEPPTVFAYIEEPYTAFKEQRGLSASRGASGALSPTETPPPPVTVTAAAAVAASTAAAAFVPVAGLLPRGRSAAAHMAASAAAARARRRPKALARRRQHRKSRRHHHASGAHRRRSGRFGVARSLLPPLASRRRISATAAGGPPETWQWQEGFMQPTERQVDGVAASAFAQRRVRPTQTPSYSSQTYSPTFTPTYSPTHPPTFSSTFSPTYSPTYDAPGTLAVTSTSAPLELQEVAAGVGAAAVRRSGRAPTQRHSRHQHVSASRRPNAIDDSLSDEEDQKRHRHNLYLGHDGVGENGSIPGVPGRDYPTYSKPPVRNFSCLDFKGRRGYVADPTTRCQVFYICPGDGRGKAMLCPNGTVFNQDVSVCDWWFNVKCGEQ